MVSFARSSKSPEGACLSHRAIHRPSPRRWRGLPPTAQSASGWANAPGNSCCSDSTGKIRRSRSVHCSKTVPLKRLLDIVASSVLLLLLLPLLLALAVAVRVLIGRPVIFRQRRPGLHGEAFELLKFRTMSNAVDAGGRLLSDDKRLGRFGSMLRALSLDELPELVNVLKGDMS